MKVALVTHYFPSHRGGIERVAAELAKRLAAQHGAQVVWHASDCDAPPELPGVQCVPANTSNAVEERFGVPYPIWTPGALRALAASVRSADVLHLHDCLYVPNIVASRAARRAGLPALVTQHVGMVPYRNPALRWALAAAYRTLGRSVLGGATEVVFVSDTVRRFFERFVAFRSAPDLLCNGVDSAVFFPTTPGRRRELRASMAIGSDAPLFLFVGRFVEKKGLGLLRELARQLPQIHWLLAGWGAIEPERWELSNVRVLRDRSAEELAHLYQAADLLVLPSVGEGFPLVVQEAMACGTPALVGVDTAAACPDARAMLLSEAVDGVDAVSRWERRLRELVLQPETLSTLRAPVAEYAATRWSWDACAQRYAEILSRLAAR